MHHRASRSSRPWATLGFALVVALLVLAVPAGAHGDAVPGLGGGQPMVRDARLGPASVPSAASPAGTPPATQRLSLEFVLPPSHPAQLSSLLHALYDPAAPQYHHWLTAAQFAAQFDPSPSTVAGVDGWLAGVGLHPDRVSGFSIRVSAPASTVENGLGVSLRDFEVGGTRFYTANQAPLMPAALSGSVVGVLGLDTLPRLNAGLLPAPTSPGERASSSLSSPSSVAPRVAGVPHADGVTPCAAATTVAGLAGGLTADQVGSYYHVGSLIAGGESGLGSIAAVYELAPHSTTDVSVYEQCFGLQTIVGTVKVDGGSSADSLGTMEADADIEDLATQAPESVILSYEGPNTGQGEYDTWASIVGGDIAKVVSTSWGNCEPDAEVGGLAAAEDALFQQAAIQGQTILSASGDSGSEDCFAESNGTDTSLEVDFPSSDPSVTAVGGTQIENGGEVAWNTCESVTTDACARTTGNGAGGGGISQISARPTWQPADWEWGSKVYPCGTNCRDVPDLAANAGIPEVFYTEGAWGAGFGTSVASPLVAGLVADVAGGCTNDLGILAPTLYGLVGQPQFQRALTDVTSGDNDLTRTYSGTRFPATAGYDTATGLGTPLADGWTCPQVTAVSPSAARPGDQVTVTGLGLQGAAVSFGSTPAQVVASNSTSATVVVPTGSGTASVSAANEWGTGSADAAFAYVAPTPPPTANASGYDLVGQDGGVFVFPTGQPSGFYGSLPGIGVVVHDVVGMVPSNDDRGYFLVGADGGVFAFGDAPFLGSLPGLGIHVNDIRGIVPTPDDRGYFLVGADGGVFAFGDAPFLGSLPGLGVHVDDVVGIAAVPLGGGYWVVEANGTVHAFGDAPLLGSVSGSSSPITTIAAAPGGGGYWVVTQGGGVYDFGYAGSYGSLPSIGVVPSRPVVGIVPTADARGYWLIGTDGGIFAFGDAPFVGSLPGLGVQVGDIVGAVPT
jgi:hypothetical protein